MKAAIYLRVSTDRQDEHNQLQDCEDYCRQNNWTVTKIYRDHGISAYKENIIRPQYEQMINDAKQKHFSHIVVWDLDRFSRQEPIEVLQLIKKLRIIYNVEVNAVHGDEWRDLIEMINSIPNMGFMGEALCDFLEKIIRGMQATQARRESEKISRRIHSSLRFQKAKDEGRVGRPQHEIDNGRILDCKTKNPNWGIRKIAKHLNLSKYAVEKCLKNTPQESTLSSP